MTDIVERLRSRAWEHRWHRKYREEAADEIEAFRELLRICRAVRDELAAEHYAALAQQRSEPVAWLLEPKVQRYPNRPLTRGIYAVKPTDEQVRIAELDGDRYVPLYAAPQQREPLTLNQIMMIWDGINDPEGNDIEAFARAVERAHGITGETP